MDLTLQLQKFFCLSLPGDWGHKREHPTPFSLLTSMDLNILVNLWEEENWAMRSLNCDFFFSHGHHYPLG